MGGSIGGILDSAVGIGTFGLVDTDFSGQDAGRDAARATEKAANISAKAQMAALNYLKEREALPQKFREEAIQQLAGAFGVPGGASAESVTQAIESSPIYGALLGDIGQQEEAILRNQSATGALRSSGTEQMLAENQRVNRAKAFTGALQGIQGLASVPSNASQIAQGMSNIGMTQAQGVQGAEQARQVAQQQGMGNLLGLGQLGLGAVAAFCDPRLKSNPVKIGEIGGVQIYEWDWNEEAKKLGLTGKGKGPMADEIKKLWPDRVTTKHGYLYVEAA
jgi:hypothetical protein